MSSVPVEISGDEIKPSGQIRVDILKIVAFNAGDLSEHLGVVVKEDPIAQGQDPGKSRGHGVVPLADHFLRNAVSALCHSFAHALNG